MMIELIASVIYQAQMMNSISMITTLANHHQVATLIKFNQSFMAESVRDSGSFANI